MKIKSQFYHFNFNITDLEKSIEFYDKALGLVECSRKVAEDGSYIIVYLTDGSSNFYLELTWIAEHPEKYDLGEEEFHLCMKVAGDYDTTRAYHREMDCICFENEEMGLYFIQDPDGYWIEILPDTHKL